MNERKLITYGAGGNYGIANNMKELPESCSECPEFKYVRSEVSGVKKAVAFCALTGEVFLVGNQIEDWLFSKTDMEYKIGDSKTINILSDNRNEYCPLRETSIDEDLLHAIEKPLREEIAHLESEVERERKSRFAAELE